MMPELVGLSAAFLCGLALGNTIARLPDPDVIERFHNRDQKFYERWKAFKKIEARASGHKDGTLLK